MKILYVEKYEEEKIPKGAVALNTKIFKSEEEILLAYELTKRSYKNKKNIAKKFNLEFLLWLAGKTDIKSAIKATAPKKGEKAIIVVFNDEKIPNTKKAKLKKKAQPLDLERISISRIKN